MIGFGAEFTKNQGRPIMVNGERVVQLVKRPIDPGSRIRVVWRRTIEAPVQGIRIKVRHGKLLLGDQELEDVVLWRDTAPDEVVFAYRSKKASEVLVWNCWRDDLGVVQAWIGNAGIRVREETSDHVTVDCNSRREITFTDLSFDIFFDERA
jgi:hypothetical protein